MLVRTVEIIITCMLSIFVYIHLDMDVPKNEKGDKTRKKTWGIIRMVGIGFSVLLSIPSILNVFIPTNKELAAIFGGYYAINNAELQEMPTKAAKVINKFMDDYLEDGSK